ncbi:MAG TPA: V-type ATPase 116kDa subunit family protein [Gemmatimonadales bacterium]
MIVKMSKVRILGPRDRLGEVLGVLQDTGVLHLSPPRPTLPLRSIELTAAQQRLHRNLRRVLADLDAVGTALPPTVPPRDAPAPATSELARWARLVGRVRRMTDRLAGRVAALEEERALLLKYRQLFASLAPLLPQQNTHQHGRVYHLVLRPGQEAGVQLLRQELATFLGEAFELHERRLPDGEIAVLLLVPATAAERTERLLAAGRVHDVPLPGPYRGKPLAEAIPDMAARLRGIPRELAQIQQERERLARAHGEELARARAVMYDHLARLEALPFSATSRRAFVLEGWLPTARRQRLTHELAARVGDTVVVEEVGREEWKGDDAPVILSNPRLFRPFELIVRQLPLPRYGSLDPTPFVAVFFPMFFGLMLGDIGYGAVLAGLGLLLHRRSRPGSVLRTVAEIAGPCAAFTIIFGALYGELFGDLGHHWLGLRPLLFNREEAIVPFLGLAVALGLVHVLLGLGLGVANALRGRHPRAALGRGLTALMILLILAALLASIDVLPAALFTPSVIALLVVFPILIFAEGIVAPIELLATIGNVLSYARIMALGVASVMLAVVANRMAGALGSAVVGAVFALLFHLVNFALGLFSPTIHALRLHYVEFFGRFYSPGGLEYHPLARWTPPPRPTS